MLVEHYDALETRDPDQRDDDHIRRLPDLISLALSAPGWVAHLAGTDPNTITSRAALATLPILRDRDVDVLLEQFPPFGGLQVYPVNRMRRLVVLPGPDFVLESSIKDCWGAARALFAAGFRNGDFVHNAFNREPIAAGPIMESGTDALGCTMINVASDDAYLHLATIQQLKPRGYVGGATVLQALLEAAVRANQEITSLQCALVCGEPLTQDAQASLMISGVTACECLITDSLGVIAYESPGCDGLLVNENLIVELIAPNGRHAVEPGDVGELVITSLNPDLPMIRRATGIYSSELKGRSPCGRTNMRLRGKLDVVRPDYLEM